MKTSLAILAAGMGSRYGGLKQIDPIGPSGEIVIDYSIHDALAAGFEKIIFIIRRDIEDDFRAAVGKKYENRAEIHYAFQDIHDIPANFSVPEGRTKPWGTGHALLSIESHVDEPFAILNADDFYGAGGFRSLRTFLTHSTDPTAYALVGFILSKTLSPNGSVSRGICRTDDQLLLQEVAELTHIDSDVQGVFNTAPDGNRQPLSGDEFVSMNLWGFTPSVFEQFQSLFEEFLRAKGTEAKSEFYIPSAVDQLIQRQLATVRVLPSEDRWFGVTYPEDKPDVMRNIRELVDSGAYRSPLWDLQS